MTTIDKRLFPSAIIVLRSGRVRVEDWTGNNAFPNNMTFENEEKAREAMTAWEEATTYEELLAKIA